jgi:hypothetical protein
MLEWRQPGLICHYLHDHDYAVLQSLAKLSLHHPVPLSAACRKCVTQRCGRDRVTEAKPSLMISLHLCWYNDTGENMLTLFRVTLHVKRTKQIVLYAVKLVCVRSTKYYFVHVQCTVFNILSKAILQNFSGAKKIEFRAWRRTHIYCGFFW